MHRIAPVPAKQQVAALEFVLAGGASFPWVRAQAEVYRDLFRRCAQSGSALWWARDGRRTVAGALVLASPGRVGFLYFSAPEAPDVDRAALVELLRSVSVECLADLAMVQAFIRTNQDDHAALLRASGFEPLLELITMECPLAGMDLPPGPWRFVSVQEFGQDALARLIRQTYERTRDCPRLSGVRTMEDVLASHRNSGRYEPQWWQIALDADGTPCGVILVNRSLRDPLAEVVYMGVAPAYRGRGLGEALLARASAMARGGACPALRLAVDAANDVALELYSRTGFMEVSRKQVFARFSTALANNL